MASGGMSPIGAWSLMWGGSVSVGEMPAFRKDSLRYCRRAWAEGSVVASQLASFWALLVSHDDGSFLLVGGWCGFAFCSGACAVASWTPVGVGSESGLEFGVSAGSMTRKCPGCWDVEMFAEE